MEPAATALAAELVDAEGIATLRALADPPSPDAGHDALIEQDLRFHHQIAVFGGNQVLCSLLETLSGPTMRARTWRGLTEDDSWQRTIREHHAIVDALESRDASAAHAWSTVHISGVEQWLRRMT
ncbi:FadR/GntR family transcriptional regulator [Embleya sp. NPDC050493]|uniref:FadR/GntR family transcriptional regulator n=1 Tax=Embleya sp. NPDC050493 TaxID=3363989 RepID=UPI0037B24535